MCTGGQEVTGKKPVKDVYGKEAWWDVSIPEISLHTSNSQATTKITYTCRDYTAVALFF